MRVVGGESRGRTLRAPVGKSVRPTSDRVREAIFDMLGSVVDLGGMRVLDLFAGTGAMGIEALSRGAGSVVFVEADKQALRAVRKNLESVGLGSEEVKLVRADALSWLSGRGTVEVDLAFVDPPYAFDEWGRLLGVLRARFAVLESDRAVAVPDGFEVVRTKRYGGTLVTVLRAAGAAVRGATS